jgi:dCMP deaminase
MATKISKQVRHRKDALSRHRQWLTKAAKIAHLPVSQGGSPHPSVRVGAILVDTKGRRIAASSNRFAHGIDRRRPERYLNDGRSLWINCAEQLAMMNAARRGIALKGASLYLTLEPCSVCAGLIAEAGIHEIFVPLGALRNYAKLKKKWKPSIEAGRIKLAEARVRFTAIDMDEKT